MLGLAKARSAWDRLRGGRLVSAILARGERLEAASDEELRAAFRTVRFRAAAGESVGAVIVDAFALTREAARRKLGMTHYPVQLLGGIVMAQGGIAEMQTGEGKTLTATLPAALRAAFGQGAHVATTNAYLAERDAAQMRPVYELLGLSVGTILPDMKPPQRKQAYRNDLTYAVASELAFDYLRDRIALIQSGRTETPPLWLTGDGLRRFVESKADVTIQRDLAYCLVDEADSILIDDARTPFLIGTPETEAEPHRAAAYRWAYDVGASFVEGNDFREDPKTREILLTETGVRKARRVARPVAIDALGWEELYEFIERAILVARRFRRDEHYIVRDGELVLVTEATGRLAEGRHYTGGIHQALQTREGIKVTGETGSAAQITAQSFFRQYALLGGMTGTARSSAGELAKVYNLPVTKVPTNKPSRRERLKTRVFATAEAKRLGMVEEIARVRDSGRPVLVGTRTIDESLLLGERLATAGVPHRILNAREHEAEAAIVAEAGKCDHGVGRVTVATNMAGRGTDIKLSPEAAAAGGLYVIAAEMHESARIDRQLYGRCARQGDPGTVRQFVSLEDELLLQAYGASRVARLIASATARPAPESGSFAEPTRSELRSASRWLRPFRSAQTRLESRHSRQRRQLLDAERRRYRSQRDFGQEPALFAPGD